jgi:OOP family OmpA-OmpF porin
MRTVRRSTRTLATAAALAAVAFPAQQAAAQSVGGIALNQFDAAPAGDPFFGVTSPLVVGHLQPRAVAMFDYAHAPLRLLQENGDSTAIVSAQGFVRVDASFALWDRLLVSVDMPFAVLQSGEEPGGGITYNAPTSAAVGDLRIGARGRLFGERGAPIAIGLEGFVFVPTAPGGSYAGEGAVRGSARALFGGRFDAGVPFVWNLGAGAHLRGSGNPSSFIWGAGVAALLLDDKLQIGPEAYGAVNLGDKNPLSSADVVVSTPSTVNAEVLLGARFRIASFQLGAAGGPGLTSAIGTPQFRVIAMFGWVPLPAPSTKPSEGGKVAGTQGGGIQDADGDGFRDDIDACPKEKGDLQGDPAKDGCPAPDRDKDGVLDIDDACPGLAGARRGDVTKNGCPDDKDGDGVHDPIDACIDRKGTESKDPKLNGCPADADGDGIFDDVDACPGAKGVADKDARFNGCTEDIDSDEIKNAQDACPFDKGIHTKDAKDNGCMKWVRVTDKEIQILAQVEFKVYGKSRQETIDPVSDDLLKEVRDAINQHPEIKKIEVQGHTDDSGNPAFNMNLSQQRADAVRQWLVTAGIAGDKLVAKGYGHTMPVADNRISEGRQKNRRVHFVVTERSK